MLLGLRSQLLRHFTVAREAFGFQQTVVQRGLPQPPPLLRRGLLVPIKEGHLLSRQIFLVWQCPLLDGSSMHRPSPPLTSAPPALTSLHKALLSDLAMVALPGTSLPLLSLPHVSYHPPQFSGPT